MAIINKVVFACLMACSSFVVFQARAIGGTTAAAAIGAAGAALEISLANNFRPVIGLAHGLGLSNTEAQVAIALFTPLLALEAYGNKSLFWAKWAAVIIAVSKIVERQMSATRGHIDHRHVGFMTALIAIAVYTLVQNGVKISEQAISDFIAMFFTVFGSLKLMNLKDFADPFSHYDIVASAIVILAYVYPFIEFGVGAAYLSDLWVKTTKYVTLGLSIEGVLSALRKLIGERGHGRGHVHKILGMPIVPLSVIETALMTAMAWIGWRSA